MVKIGVISDTHFIETEHIKIPAKVREVFKAVDKIFHAGDVISQRVLKELARLAPVLAVRGNMDLLPELKSLPPKLIEQVEEVKIGLIHGWGPPTGIIERVKSQFPSDVDCIVFGHTHSPLIERRDGILFFNPGAAVDKIYSLVNSVGILTINGKDIQAEIIEL